LRKVSGRDLPWGKKKHRSGKRDRKENIANVALRQKSIEGKNRASGVEYPHALDYCRAMRKKKIGGYLDSETSKRNN